MTVACRCYNSAVIVGLITCFFNRWSKLTEVNKENIITVTHRVRMGGTKVAESGRYKCTSSIATAAVAVNKRAENFRENI